MKQRVILWLLLWSLKRVKNIPLPIVYRVIQVIIEDPANPIMEAQAISMKQILAIGEVVEPCL